ncbi:MAG: acylneuraminate cytidylyltransferase family protein [Candidatus Riflebacteria bacterium]
MKLAVITARGGSKRLPRKNIMPLLGQSLIFRSAKCLLDAGCFDRVIVSTDDHEIAAEAEKAGAEIPFIRPAILASDTASSVDVLIHAVESLVADKEIKQTIVGLFQPTSPLLRPEHIKAALETFEDGNYNSLSSMCRVQQYPEWTFRESGDSNRVAPLFPDKFSLSGRHLPASFIENGAIYLVKGDWLISNKSLYDLKNHGMFLMSEHDSIDIDTREDWEMAEFFLNRLSGS